MIRRNEPPKLYGLLSDETFRWPPGDWPKRYMVVQLRFNRESFAALKELLRDESITPAHGVETASNRLNREALKLIFNQIRDREYNDE